MPSKSTCTLLVLLIELIRTGWAKDTLQRSPACMRYVSVCVMYASVCTCGLVAWVLACM